MPKIFSNLWTLFQEGMEQFSLLNSRSFIAIILGFLVHTETAIASDCIAASGVPQPP